MVFILQLPYKTAVSPRKAADMKSAVTCLTNSILFQRVALRSVATFLFTLSTVGLTPAAWAGDFTIAAASSLQDALNELKPALQMELKDVSLRISAGASGTLQQQIMQGAPIDLFLSADNRPVRVLTKANQLVPGSSFALLANQLVLIAPNPSSIASIADLKSPKFKRIAIGEPRTVPAGDYAMQTLSWLKLDKDLSGRFVFAKDVRQVLSYVERGEVDAGFVYRSDLESKAGKSVTLVSEAPAGSHKPIRYFAAVVAASKHQMQAKKLLSYLKGPKAALVWAKYGFSPLSPVASVGKAKVSASK